MSLGTATRVTSTSYVKFDRYTITLDVENILIGSFDLEKYLTNQVILKNLLILFQFICSTIRLSNNFHISGRIYE